MKRIEENPINGGDVFETMMAVQHRSADLGLAETPDEEVTAAQAIHLTELNRPTPERQAVISDNQLIDAANHPAVNTLPEPLKLP